MGLVWARETDLSERATGHRYVRGDSETLLRELIALDAELILDGTERSVFVQVEPGSVVPRLLVEATPDVSSPDEPDDEGTLAWPDWHARAALVAPGEDVATELGRCRALILLGDRRAAGARLRTLRERVRDPEVQFTWLQALWNQWDMDGRAAALREHEELYGRDLTWVRYTAYYQVITRSIDEGIVARLKEAWADPQVSPTWKGRLTDLLMFDSNAVSLEQMVELLPSLDPYDQMHTLEPMVGVAERHGWDEVILTWVPRLMRLRARIGDRVAGPSVLTLMALLGDHERGSREVERLYSHPVQMTLARAYFEMIAGDPVAVERFADGLEVARTEGYDFGIVAMGAGMAASDPQVPFPVVRDAERLARQLGPAAFLADLCVRSAETNTVNAARWYGAARVMDPRQPERWAEAARATGVVPVADFDVFEELGRGKQGRVHRALHRPSGRLVALKLLDSAKHAEGLRHEAGVQAALYHPAVLRVLGAGQVPAEHVADGLPAGSGWMAMELAGGGSLLQSEARPPPEQVLAQVLSALAHCHARGVLHLDLKPANLLLARDGSIRLADFGVAGVVGRRPERIRGTPAYIAPELWGGKTLDERTDLYGLGCVAYELLEGIPPFLGPWKAVRQCHQERPVPATGHALDAWIARATAKDPGRRFENAAQALEALPGGPWPAVVGEPRAGLALVPTCEVPLLGREALIGRIEAGLEQDRVALVGREGAGREALLQHVVHRAREAGRAAPPAEQLAVFEEAPQGWHVIEVPPLTRAQLQSLGLAWGASAEVVERALQGASGPGALKQRLLELPPVQPAPEGAHPLLARAQTALEAGASDDAVDALEALLGSASADPSLLPGIQRARVAATTLGLPRDHLLFARVHQLFVAHAHGRKQALEARALLDVPAWTGLHDLAHATEASTHEALEQLERLAPADPFAAAQVLRWRAELELGCGRPIDPAVGSHHQAHPQTLSPADLFLRQAVLAGQHGAVDAAEAGWVGLYAGRPGEHAGVLGLVDALLRGTHHPDGVFRARPHPPDEQVRLGVLLVSCIDGEGEAWQSVLGRFERPMPELAGRLLAVAEARAPSERCAAVTEVLERMAGAASRAAAWRALTGDWV